MPRKVPTVATASKCAVHDNEKTVTRRLALPPEQKNLILGGNAAQRLKL